MLGSRREAKRGVGKCRWDVGRGEERSGVWKNVGEV